MDHTRSGSRNITSQGGAPIKKEASRLEHEQASGLSIACVPRPSSYGDCVRPESGRIHFAPKYPFSASDLERFTNIMRDTKGYDVLTEDTMRRAASYAAFAAWIMAHQGRPWAIRTIYTKLSERDVKDAASLDHYKVNLLGRFIHYVSHRADANKFLCKYARMRDALARTRNLETLSVIVFSRRPQRVGIYRIIGRI